MCISIVDAMEHMFNELRILLIINTETCSQHIWKYGFETRFDIDIQVFNFVMSSEN